MSSLHDTIQSLESLLGHQLNAYEGYKARLATVDATDFAVAKDKLSAALSQVLGLLEYLKATDDRLLDAGAQETHIEPEFENQAASVHDRFHEAEGASSLGLDHINRLATEIAEFQTIGLARLREQISAGKSRLDTLSSQTNERLAHLERQIGGIQNRIRTTNNAIRDVQVQKDSTQSTLNNKRNELHNKERQRDAANAESARARERRDGARAAGVGLGILSIFAGPLAPVVFAATAGSLAYASDQDNVARARQNEANVLRQECQTLEIQIGGQNDRLAAHNHDLQRSQNERSQAEQEKAALEREQSAQRAEKQILVNLEARVADLGTQVPSLNGKTATLSSEISAIRTHTMNCTVMISEARVKAGCLEYADSRNEILGTVKTMVSGFPIGGGVVERIGAVIGELERRSLAAAH
ncbi:unnamed protein product [Tuber melanosporum]|jgi:chromosome segregation ATPase|uniref:(Perigord truffle) hypothetical protein n=1 Tax=Tuber melanosporum (strain Mel28) TaxID=656061 RepID=D5G5A1_TUBMM|nr:uncharacterized protein GSTUM_00004243001 [Tuber melanosporum]CAZ79694.1 unnamed protein product [Tuber melanosporum]